MALRTELGAPHSEKRLPIHLLPPGGAGRPLLYYEISEHRLERLDFRVRFQDLLTAGVEVRPQIKARCGWEGGAERQVQ